MIIMLATKESITNFIPQRAPFVMIDALESATEEGFKTHFHIESDNLFLENGQLSESSLIENIAQTCAAGFGYINSQKGTGEGQLGFIGAISKLFVTDFAKLGDSIETNVTILSSFENIHLIEGIASRNGNELVKCQMKIVIA